MKIQKLLFSSILATGLAFNASSMDTVTGTTTEDIQQRPMTKIEGVIAATSTLAFLAFIPIALKIDKKLGINPNYLSKIQLSAFTMLASSCGVLPVFLLLNTPSIKTKKRCGTLTALSVLLPVFSGAAMYFRKQ